MALRITRRFALAGFGAALAAPAVANAPLTSLRPQPRPGSLGVRRAADIVAEAGLTGTTAFVAASADGSILEARNGQVELPPASVAKALTALYAVDTLGPSYRFATVVMGTGPLNEGVLEGDLILKGTGDPILDTDALAGLARQLRDAGLTRIAGSFLVDGRGLETIDQIDPSQLVQAGYNPTVSGLNLNYNRVHFEWRRSGGEYRLTMDARAERYQPRVSHATMRVVPEAYPVFTHRAGDVREHWTVARPALGNGGARWLPVRQPELYAGDVFRTLAAAMGITLPPAGRDEGPLRGAVLASHVSPTLRGLCGGMLRYSTNLTAEVIGLRASAARNVAPGGLTVSAAAMNAWAQDRYGAELSLVDHSGLGDQSRVSCEALTQVLTRTDRLAPMLKDIAVKNSQGSTVSNPGYVIKAKTGTLNFVSSLAGYVTPQNAPPIAFAIISSDLPRRAAVPEQDKDRPPGSRTYARRARAMQQALIARWAQLAVDA